MQQTQIFARVPAQTSLLPQAPAEEGRRGRSRQRRPSRRRRPWRTALLAALAVTVGYAALLLALVVGNLDRVEAFPAGERPAPAPGMTWLLVGSDSRDSLTEEQKAQLSTGDVDSRLTDTIMMLTTSPGGVPTLVSIPRDSLVTIPGYGQNKINAAYAIGGPPLLVQTVEQATGVRVDGYVEVGFDGFFEVVEAVDGVEVCLETAIADERAGIDLAAGCQVLGGADALGYVRSRYTDPDGDLGRVERQRQVIAALADRATSPAVLLNPLRAVPLSSAVGDALTVDEQAGPVDLARFGLALLRATGDGGAMLTVPFGGYATTDAGSVVLWDEAGAEALFAAIRTGTAVPAELLP
jgi:LCP family protein required for cell wall assembly